MKPKTQKNIGLVTAAILFIVGIYKLVFQVHLLLDLLGLLETTIFSAIYFLALRARKVRTAQVIYRGWWIIGLIVLSTLFLGLLLFGFWRVELKYFRFDLYLLLYVGVSFGLITLLWWIGLRGLQRIVETERMSTDEQKQ